MRDKKTLTRADLVRQRRKKDDTRRLAPTTERASRPAPAIASRNVTMDAATVRKPKAKAARQYQALAAAPAAGRMFAPALPRIHIRVGWRLLSFFLVGLLGAALYYTWTAPMFRVAGTTLVGNQFVTVEEINSTLGLGGTHIFLLTPAKIETALRLHFPEITSVKVSVALPNTVTATITERQPLVRWEQDGGFAWLDAEGVAFRPRDERSGLVVVMASGSAPTGPRSESDALAPIPLVHPQIVETARLLSPYVPAGSVLLYDPKYGIGWADGRGWKIWFGSSPEQLDMKLRIYTVLVDSLAQRGIAPTFINVAHLNAPYYRLGQ